MSEEEEKNRYEFVHLHSGGPLPGLPGDHAPGSYVIDWQFREITPALSIEAFLQAKQPVANQEEIIPKSILEQSAVEQETPPALPEEQQSQNEQASSETAEQQSAVNVTGDTPPPNPVLSLG